MATSTEIAELLSGLRSGRLTLEEVVEQFRRRCWTSVRSHSVSGMLAARPDPGADIPGSYDEVTAAYDRGEITSDQYDVLSDAVAEAIGRVDRREGPVNGP
jgi:hypothetical protein